MKIVDRIRNQIDHIIGEPGSSDGRWTRLMRFQIKLWRYSLQRLKNNNAMAMSAALSFRTIFALVPTLVLIMLIMTNFGNVKNNEYEAVIQKLLQSAGLNISVSYDDEDNPAMEQDSKTAVAKTEGQFNVVSAEPSETVNSGKQVNVAEMIHKLIAKVKNQLTFGRIGPIGVALLIWTAITLLATVERSLNRIYGVQKSRPLARQVMMYWTILTLGPIILTVVKYVGERAIKFSATIPGSSWVLLSVGWVMPILVGIILLGLLYKLLPYTQVDFRWAMAGAIAAVPCWVIAKWLFGLYVTEIVVARKSLYGALGLLPIFLMWLNLSWWIFLLGAEFSQVLANFKRIESAELADKTVLGPLDALAMAIAVAKPYEAGQGPVTFDRLVDVMKLPMPAVQKIVDQLSDRNVICPVDVRRGVSYTLAKPSDQITIMNVCSFDGRAESLRAGQYDESITGQIVKIQSHVRDTMGRLTLRDAIM